MSCGPGVPGRQADAPGKVAGERREGLREVYFLRGTAFLAGTRNRPKTSDFPTQRQQTEQNALPKPSCQAVLKKYD